MGITIIWMAETSLRSRVRYEIERSSSRPAEEEGVFNPESVEKRSAREHTMMQLKEETQITLDILSPFLYHLL